MRGPGPAQRGDARAHRVVGLAPHEGVDDERLEACVPRSAHLGRTCVDLGGGERDLARVPQDGLSQVTLGTRDRELVRVRLDDVDDHPDELKSVLQGDRLRELRGGCGEDLGDAARGARRLLVPGDE